MDDRGALAIGGVVPAAVARPADAGEIAAVVAEVAAQGGALVPLGLGAHRMLGHAPRRYDLALSTAHLARIVDYAPADMTVVVESGATIAEVQATLSAASQWLPVDPPHPQATTIGGLVAADLGGPVAASQGRVRDHVIGISVVDAGGRTARGGGRVVKNVAGYDLMKLFTGSLGTLGIVTDVTFKVRPRPEVVRCIELAATDLAHGLSLADRVMETRLGALTATLLWEVGDSNGRPSLLVLLAGVEEDVAVLCERVRAIATDVRAEISLDTEAASPEAQARVGRVRDFVRAEPGELIARLVQPPRRAPAVGAALASGAAGPGGITGHCLLDVLGGVVTTALATPDVRATYDALRRLARAEDARLVIERWPPVLASTVEVWSPLPSAFALMRRMKLELDPAGTLAPGRFVGRL